MEEILHQLIDGLSMFIPLLIGFQQIKGDAGFRNHPLYLLIITFNLNKSRAHPFWDAFPSVHLW